MASLLRVVLFFAILGYQTDSSLAITKSGHSKYGSFKKQKGMVLVGHVISSHQVTSPIDCSFLCAANDECKTYNYKPGGAGDQDVCQLNNATRRTHPASYKADAGFVHYYDESEDFKSCLDYLRSGVQENGIYTITDTTGSSYQVYCDLTSEPRSAWTLIFSYAFKSRNINGFSKPALTVNLPDQENTPNWEAYRLSLSRMQHLSQQSTHVRSTTGFDTYGVDFRDYLRAKISSLDILTFLGSRICKSVEFIDIRGNRGNGVTVPFWQSTAYGYNLHTDSSTYSCSYDGRAGSVNSEDNFGNYASYNLNFRGSANDESTTEYWFGGYL